MCSRCALSPPLPPPLIRHAFVAQDSDDTGAERLSKLATQATAAEQGIDEEKVFMDMPPSWVTRLHIPRGLFQARCPSGKKTIVYRKGMLTKFAPYSREDGLVEQISIFADAARTEVHSPRSAQ